MTAHEQFVLDRACQIMKSAVLAPCTCGVSGSELHAPECECAVSVDIAWVEAQKQANDEAEDFDIRVIE